MGSVPCVYRGLMLVAGHMWPDTLLKLRPPRHSILAYTCTLLLQQHTSPENILPTLQWSDNHDYCTQTSNTAAAVAAS